jgi:hypothetical protein
MWITHLVMVFIPVQQLAKGKKLEPKQVQNARRGRLTHGDTATSQEVRDWCLFHVNCDLAISKLCFCNRHKHYSLDLCQLLPYKNSTGYTWVSLHEKT